MDEMSDEELERMAYDVIDCRPVSICMCGGEPLLRKESIYKIANYSKNTLCWCEYGNKWRVND